MNGGHRHRADLPGVAVSRDPRAAWQRGYRRKAPRQRYQGTHRSEEFRRRVRFVASGQIELRRIDGWRKIAGVLGQHTPVAA